MSKLRFMKLSRECGKEWDNHWHCLDEKNNHLWKCREQEKVFNKCVFEKFGYKKVIPDSPEYEVPIHLRKDSQRLYK
jgi:NADH dehydrogenase (ubiquinone) 1 alpha subcomplex subunit 8